MNAATATQRGAVRLGWVFLAAWALRLAPAADTPGPNCQFMGIENFAGFSRTLTSAGTVVLVSPVITTELEWDELVLSWNARLAPAASLRVEARACYPDRATRFYVMGLWSPGPEAPARRSVTGQQDDDGDVQTDILALTRPARRVEVRLTFQGPAGPAGDLDLNRKVGQASRRPTSRINLSPSTGCVSDSPETTRAGGTPALLSRRPRSSIHPPDRIDTHREPSELSFLGLSFLNTRIPASCDAVSGTEPVDPLPVPQRSQLAYEAGAAWCSPTAVSMILGYWAERCGRPEWDRTVPDVAAGVFDPNWPGTGNWPFNTAYAGALPGMRGHVTRLAGLEDLASWLRSGVPVAASVSHSVLQGLPHNGNGHLVVCVGLTDAGDVVVNDPGTRHEIRRAFPQTDFLRAWDYSHRTVYVVHPKDWPVPRSGSD